MLAQQAWRNPLPSTAGAGDGIIVATDARADTALATSTVVRRQAKLAMSEEPLVALPTPALPSVWSQFNGGSTGTIYTRRDIFMAIFTRSDDIQLCADQFQFVLHLYLYLYYKIKNN